AAERFVDKLDESIAELKQRLDKWADDFKEAPAYRLEWSQTTFEQAAQWRVLVIVRDALTGDRTTLEQIRDIAYENALMNNVPSSTSVPSNLLELNMHAAWCNIAQRIERFIENDVRKQKELA